MYHILEVWNNALLAECFVSKEERIDQGAGGRVEGID